MTLPEPSVLAVAVHSEFSGEGTGKTRQDVNAIREGRDPALPIHPVVMAEEKSDGWALRILIP